MMAKQSQAELRALAHGGKVVRKQRVAVAGGFDPAKFSKEDFEYAAADAQHLVKESKVLQTLIGADILSRRLYLLVRGALASELRGGWTVHNTELVERTLVMSAENKANEKFTAAEVLRGMEETIVPMLKVFAQMEQEGGTNNVDESTTSQSGESTSGPAVRPDPQGLPGHDNASPP